MNKHRRTTTPEHLHPIVRRIASRALRETCFLVARLLLHEYGPDLLDAIHDAAHHLVS